MPVMLLSKTSDITSLAPNVTRYMSSCLWYDNLTGCGFAILSPSNRAATRLSAFNIHLASHKIIASEIYTESKMTLIHVRIEGS